MRSCAAGGSMHIHRSEKIWLGFGVATRVIFLCIIGAAAISDGIAPASHVQTIDPTRVAQTPPFDNPGVHRLADGSYEADIVGHIFAFTPTTISVPAGAKVTFF